MKYIIVIAAFFSFSCFAQDQPSFEDAPSSDQELQESSLDEALESSLETDPPPNPTGTSTEASPSEVSNPGSFDVFQPSEDISEDLSVPFPADI